MKYHFFICQVQSVQHHLRTAVSVHSLKLQWTPVLVMNRVLMMKNVALMAVRKHVKRQSVSALHIFAVVSTDKDKNNIQYEKNYSYIIV